MILSLPEGVEEGGNRNPTSPCLLGLDIFILFVRSCSPLSLSPPESLEGLPQLPTLSPDHS